MKKNEISDLFKKRKWLKICLAMKFAILLLLVTSFNLTAAVYSQAKVTLEVENASFEHVVRQLENKTEYRFIYNDSHVAKISGITFCFEDEEIEVIMEACLRGTPYTYRLMENMVIIVPRMEDTSSLPQVKTHKITGKVVDMHNNPLPGVTVLLKGTTLGVSTDVDGNFTLDIPQSDKPSVLIFSFVGMKTIEQTVSDDKPLEVKMEDDEGEISEVVVTGYFNKTKESFTGSSVAVRGEELRQVGTLNVLQALSAFDPSIRVEENIEFGSDPNKIPEITIRGENGFDLRGSADDSQTNPNAPLYVLDGVEVTATRVYDLDMNRIDQLTVLKDASATALYGSRGANGVIIITTVRPKSGEIRVNVNANYNISVPDLRDYNLMNAEEKLRYEKLAGVWTNQLGNYEDQMRLDELYNSKLKEVKRGINTYWLSEPLQVSVNQRYNLYFEGGDARFRYGVDLRYDNDRGVMKKSGRQKIGINVVFNYNIGQNFFIRNDLIVDDVKGTNSPYGSFADFARQNPHDRKYTEDGKEMERLSSGNYNPMINALLPNYNHTKYTSIQDNFNIDWRIIPSLRFQGRFSLTKQIDKDEIYRSPFSTDFAYEDDRDKRGSYYTLNSNTLKIDGNFTMQFNHVWQEKHLLSVGVGSNVVTSEQVGEGFTATGFLNDNMNFVEYAAQYKENTKPTGVYDNSRMIGFFANLNYGYDNRYFIDGSFRTDGSSRFGKNSRFAPFWSVGVAWNVHNEKFWANEGASLKIRGSVGSMGTVNFSASQALTRYQYSGSYEYNGNYGAILKGYGNNSLKWQNTIAYNVGVDFTFWQNRVQLNVDGYIKITENLLLPIDIAPSTGFLSYTENMGQIKNTGMDFRIRLNLIRDREKDINWNVTLSGLKNVNKIQKLSNALEAMNAQANTDSIAQTSKPLRMYEAGRSQSALMVVKSAGIDPATGNEVYVKLNGDKTFNYDAKDKIIAGDTKPKMEGSINSNLTWKGWSLFMLFNYRWGGKVYNSTLATKVEGANPNYNADRRVLYDRWIQAGDRTKFRRIDDTTTPYQTTRLVQKDDLFALSSLSLSYDLPRAIANRIHLERLKIQASATDIFRCSTIKQERGTSYPFAQAFSIGVSATF